jgi:hypothetical protein
LGDHLYLLGARTIDWSVQTLGFRPVEPERTWLPERLYRREWFRMKGGSRFRNAAKTAIRLTPVARAALVCVPPAAGAVSNMGLTLVLGAE